jgi:cyclic pyranopterin phosphate synthase
VIDISGKEGVPRMAVASGKIRLKRESIKAIRGGKVKKGDALETAKVAALQAVKRTHELIPHCHQINVEECDVGFEVEDEAIVDHCRVKAHYKTGVEMETLVGVSVALLTVWDMVNYLEKDKKGQYPSTEITEIRVEEKVKGK